MLSEKVVAVPRYSGWWRGRSTGSHPVNQVLCFLLGQQTLRGGSPNAGDRTPMNIEFVIDGRDVTNDRDIAFVDITHAGSLTPSGLIGASHDVGGSAVSGSGEWVTTGGSLPAASRRRSLPPVRPRLVPQPMSFPNLALPAGQRRSAAPLAA